MKKMYSFIKGEYPYQDKILMLEKVHAEELSYPEEGYNILFPIEEQSFWFQHRNRCIEKVISAYPSKSLIDVGGGNGCVTWHLQEQGHDVTLLEPSIKGCQNARRRGVEKVICGLFKEEYIKPHTVEGICLFDVLEHIEDDRRFLEFIHSRMQANARLYLTVPACKKLWSKEDEKAKHYRRYEQEELRQLLEVSGFKVEFSNYFFGFLYRPIWLMRVIKGSLKRVQEKKDKEEEVLINEHKSYYMKIKPLMDYLLGKELRNILSQSTKRGSSLIIVATASKTVSGG